MTLRSVTITLDGVVTPKGSPRFVKVGSYSYAYIDGKTKAYMADLRLAAHRVMNGAPLLEGPLRLTVMVIRPMLMSFSKKDALAAAHGRKYPATKPDLTNYIKLIEDAFNCVVFRDDAQIVEQHNYKRFGDKPGVRVDVEEINEP